MYTYVHKRSRRNIDTHISRADTYTLTRTQVQIETEDIDIDVDTGVDMHTHTHTQTSTHMYIHILTDRCYRLYMYFACINPVHTQIHTT